MKLHLISNMIGMKWNDDKVKYTILYDKKRFKVNKKHQIHLIESLGNQQRVRRIIKIKHKALVKTNDLQ